MPAGQETFLLDPNKVHVPERRRKDLGDIDELADSISRYGQFHAIIIDKELNLIAGERRLTACKRLRATVECKYLDQLDEHEARAVEIEENARRLNLKWTEEAEAVRRYHELRTEEDPDWDLEMTADTLNLGSQASVQRRVTVAQAITSGKDHLKKCEGLTAAYTMLQREQSRELDDEVEKFLEADEEGEEAPVESDALTARTGTVQATAHPRAREAINDVFNVPFEDFLTKDWDGSRFNVLHCDFPYGIGHQRSEQGGMQKWGEGNYSDEQEIFHKLVYLVAETRHKLLSDSAHLIFWYPVAKYNMAVECVRRMGFDRVDPVPLIWHKADATGILPDPQRGPRRVYEAALFASRGDRKIIRAVSNTISVPAAKSKAQHPSEKPYKVVEYFLQMVVDEYARVLDPTCGSGTAVAAADVLGAQRVVGVEENKIHAKTARSQLNRVRV